MSQRRRTTEARKLYKWQVPQLAGTMLLWIMAAMPTTAYAQELTSFTDGVGKHVVFVANDYHVHQLRCFAVCYVSSSWIHEDLTHMAGGPSFMGNSFGSANLVSFSDPVGEHVFYRDPNTNHINQLLFAGGVWSNQDLGVSVGAMRMSGYGDGGIEALFYTSVTSHVHVLMSLNGRSWSDSDLTTETQSTPAGNFGDTTSFHDAAGEHTVYMASDGHLHQFLGRWTERPICIGIPPRCTLVSFIAWANQDLGGPPYFGGRLSSFSDATGVHIFYFQDAFYTGLHIYEHFGPSGGSAWMDHDWGAAYGTNPFGMGLTSFGSSKFGEQLFYVGASDLHVYQHSGQNGVLLQTEDLTRGTNAPPVSASCAELLTSFTDSSAGWVGEDVFYPANDGDLHYLSRVFLAGLYFWLDSNLTQGFIQPTIGGEVYCR